jgi:hypothetical protein
MTKEKLIEKLVDAIGRADAERMAGIFFLPNVVSIDGKSIAESIAEGSYFEGYSKGWEEAIKQKRN